MGIIEANIRYRPEAPLAFSTNQKPPPALSTNQWHRCIGFSHQTEAKADPFYNWESCVIRCLLTKMWLHFSLQENLRSYIKLNQTVQVIKKRTFTEIKRWESYWSLEFLKIECWINPYIHFNCFITECFIVFYIIISLICVTLFQEEGWLMGVKESTGQKGLFPANFSRPI